MPEHIEHICLTEQTVLPVIQICGNVSVLVFLPWQPISSHFI